MRFCAIFGLATRSAPKNPQASPTIGPRAASSGLTMRQCGGAFCIDPEQAPAPFMNSKPQRQLPLSVESPLSGVAALCRKNTGIVMGGLFDNRGGGAV
jgi:hypothetical protein